MYVYIYIYIYTYIYIYIYTYPLRDIPRRVITQLHSMHRSAACCDMDASFRILQSERRREVDPRDLPTTKSVRQDALEHHRRNYLTSAVALQVHSEEIFQG